MTVIAGKLGYIARGVALIFVGLGVLTAGVTHQASKSKGLDGALHQMVTLPLGQVLVAVVAAGFACFGVYLFSRARRART
jgi:multisubunit Na+/H+ antiporter MnhC subunit